MNAWGTGLPSLTFARPLITQLASDGSGRACLAPGAALWRRLGHLFLFAILSTVTGGHHLSYFLPVRFYGTTVALIEGKVLRVVETAGENSPIPGDGLYRSRLFSGQREFAPPPDRSCASRFIWPIERW